MRDTRGRFVERGDMMLFGDAISFAISSQVSL